MLSNSENYSITTQYMNGIKVVIEISTDPVDPFYREEHYNQDGFRFYHKYSSPIHKEFSLKGYYWKNCADFDMNRDINLIHEDDNHKGVIVKDLGIIKYMNLEKNTIETSGFDMAFAIENIDCEDY
jgi:hypothetical protein